MEEWRTNLCGNLHHLRQVHGLTQAQMAQILGISVSTYGRLERYDPRVRLHCGHICRVCDHFQISTDAVMYQNWRRMLEERSSP